MKAPEDSSYYSAISSNGSKLKMHWNHSFSPLSNEFFHPFTTLFHHQAPSEAFLFDQNNGTLFLKDGVLGLVVLMSKILNHKKKIINTFAIPLPLAPLIPTELQQYFLFYKYINSYQPPNRHFSDAILFLGSLTPHTSMRKLTEDLAPFQKEFRNISIISHVFNNSSGAHLTNTEANAIKLFENYYLVRELFPNAFINTISLEQFTSLDLNNIALINTNHYNFFCGEDFLSYFYLFKTGRLPLCFLNKSSLKFKAFESVHLVKNLNVSLFKYSGSPVISLQDQLTIANLPVAKISSVKYLHEYYNAKTQGVARELADNLFQLNLELRSEVA